MEINTSAWRKGLQDPYPRREIVEMWRQMGGDVVLSDDSHSVAQVGTNYDRLKEFLIGCGVGRVAYLKRRQHKDGGVWLRIGGGESRQCEVGYVNVGELW